MGHHWDWVKAKDVKEVKYNDNLPLDEDIIDSKSNLKNSEAIHGEFKLPTEDSFVQTNSDPICSSAGCTQYKHKKTPLGYDINYPVPNFGVDHDIIDSQASVSQAQTDLGHDWEFGTKASKAKWHNPAKDVDYNFAPKLDGDMITTDKNLKDAQTRLNHKWVIEEKSDYKPNYLQLDEMSDPICSSAGCT